MKEKISSMVSDYYDWFVELGYPQLDIVTFEDGEWAIREYYNCPLIPSLTRWKYVLTGLRHVEISRGFVERWINKLDLQKKEFWADQEAKSAAVAQESEDREKHREEFADKAFQLIRRNEDLMERVAKNGLSEINLDKIARHIPESKLKGHLKTVKQ